MVTTLIVCSTFRCCHTLLPHEVKPKEGHKLSLCDISRVRTRYAACILQAVQNNGTVYLHAFFAPTGFAIDPTDSFYKNGTVFSKSTSEYGCRLWFCPFNPLQLCTPRLSPRVF